MNAPFLPPVARPPHDPYRLRLDRRAGWRMQTELAQAVGVDASDGSLTLTPLPGSGDVLNDASGSFGGLAWPDHLAPLPGNGLVLIDRTRGVLRRLDACECRFTDWPCLGREHSDWRRPRNAGGIAVGCAQLYLCDTGNQRVLVINPASGNVRAQWSSPTLAGLNAWQPQDVALSSRAEVYVSDPANGGVHVFSADGRHRRFLGHLRAVSSLTLDCADRLYVRLQGEAHVIVVDAINGRVLERPLRPEEVVGRFASLPVRVLAGGAVDVSQYCEPPAQPPLIVDAQGEPTQTLPNSLAYPTQGTWISAALDSDIARCQWDRVSVRAELPVGARVELSCWTTQSEEAPALIAALPPQAWQLIGALRGPRTGAARDGDFLLRAEPGRYLWLRMVLYGDGSSTPRVQDIELDFPRVSLRRYLPAIFGAEPVAADFTDRWLAVFDRGFRDIESTIDYQARLFDPLACPADAPRADFLSWLGSWVGVALERNWPLARRRAYLAHAPSLFAWRGTMQGLRDSLYLFLGLERWLRHAPGRSDCVPCPLTPPTGWRPPRLLLEHFQLRRWLLLDHARLSDNAKLWGERIVNRSRLGGPLSERESGIASGAQLGVTQLRKAQDPCRDLFHHYAHKLSVFVPAVCMRDPGLARALHRLIELERPAHVQAQAQVIAVEPRFRVGVQAMLGLDAVIGCGAQPVQLDRAALGRATVLTGALAARPAVRVGVARVGRVN